MLNFESFLLAQPCYPEEKTTDAYYFNLVNKLIKAAEGLSEVKSFHGSIIDRSALCIIGYYQDMIADAGLWHGFIDECRRLYGTPVPFFDAHEDYMDYELNREDVVFLVWYSIAMYSDNRCIYPFDKEIVALADCWYEILETVYDEAPRPDGFHLAHELDVYAEEDREMLLKLGSWLYLHSWLLRPAFTLTSSEIISRMHAERKTDTEIAEELQNTVKTEPSGPLALYIGEWVHLTVNHKLSNRKQKIEDKETHPSFVRMIRETGGEPIKFIQGYEAFNKYLIDVLGWKPNEEHLVQLKQCQDFVLMTNPRKGLLVAPDICRCINAPTNPYYVKEYASCHAIELLTERGACPHDLLSYICENGWLTDAQFPGSDDTELPLKYHDFIARCYLQLYYRGD
ncbi:MAG: DUF3843 family protein [Lachnospiraceae bacterium]|nr:DUF3843 family protein [Lachnospiraceae bacterium]